MPEDFSFQLYPDDLDRIEWHIEDAMARVPLLGKAGISKVINGPIPYAPDGNPLIGPMPGVPNAFEACVFTFGIAQGGGAGKVLAEWITEGQTEWDMWSCDPRRYTDYTDQDYCNQKGMEVYGNEYAMHFPYHEWPFMVREMHCILIAINFHTFLVAIILVRIICITARIARPHIPFGLTFSYPFCQYFSCATSLSDTKCKHTCFKCIWNPRHWTN